MNPFLCFRQKCLNFLLKMPGFLDPKISRSRSSVYKSSLFKIFSEIFPDLFVGLFYLNILNCCWLFLRYRSSSKQSIMVKLNKLCFSDTCYLYFNRCSINYLQCQSQSNQLLKMLLHFRDSFNSC